MAITALPVIGQRFLNGKATLVAGTGTPFDLKGCNAFYIQTSGDTFVRTQDVTGTPTLTGANATTLGAGTYGPFMRPSGVGFLILAGNAGTPAVTVTLL